MMDNIHFSEYHNGLQHKVERVMWSTRFPVISSSHEIKILRLFFVVHTT